MRGRPLHRSRLFLVAFVLAAGWLFGDLLARRIMIASELKYVLPGFETLVATGSARRLWSAIDAEFGELIRHDQYEGPLFKAFRGWQDKYKFENGQKVERVSDLDALGLDTSRGVLIARYASDHTIAVVHASDVKKCLELIARSRGDEVTAPASAAPGVYTLGELVAANPEGRTLVVSNDKAMLDAALASAASSATHAFAADDLYEPVARDLRIPMLTGASAFAAIRDPSIAALRRASAIVRFDNGISIDVSADLDLAPYRVFDSMVAEPPRLHPWANELPADTLGGLMFRDHALSQYVDAIAQTKQLTQMFQEQYAGVLWELRNLPSLRQITIAATGFRAGLPDLVLGVWADPAAVEAMVTRIQTRVRLRRDQAVLRGALGAGEQPADEPNSLYARYPITDGLVGSPALTAADFANPTYERKVDGATIRLLLPPVTANDIKFRSELEPLAENPELTSDRYRLAVTRVGEAFWFATDAAVLESRLRRSTATPTLEGTPLFALSRRHWTPIDRLQLFANLDRVVDARLLSPEVGKEDQFLTYVRDLREHPAVSITITSSDNPPRARLQVRLDRRP